MGCSGSKSSKKAGEPAPRLLGKEDGNGKPASTFRMKLGAPFPDFDCDTTEGKFKFHEFLGKEGTPAWTILFSHPKDFTPVCTTELAICSGLVGKLAKMGVKMIGLSCDPVSEHTEWSKDVLAVKHQHAGLLRSLLDSIEDAVGIEQKLGFPLIADEKREIATMLGMLDPQEKDAAGIPMPARALYLIGPDKTNRATILYPATTGRNFAEVLRLVESLFLTQDFKLATPGNWKSKDRVIVTPALETEEASKKFSNLEVKELPSGKQYLRYVDCPSETVDPAKPLPPLAEPAASAQDFKIKIGAKFPDFSCKTTDGDFKFHEFLDREPSWTILFSHPKDFTPVCTTELGICSSMVAQFKSQGAKLIGLSCDSVASHEEWTKDILAMSGEEGSKLSFPLIADESREIAAQLGMLDPNERDASGVPMPARALFFIAPDKTIRATILYPATSGRNFDEVMRVLLSLRLTEDPKLATPGNWEKGDRVIVAPAVETEEAQACFANLELKELPSKKPYLRFVDCPEGEPQGEPEPGAPKEKSVVLTEVPAQKTACCCGGP